MCSGAMGVWQGVAMGLLKYHHGSLCLTLLCWATPEKTLWVGPPAGLAYLIMAVVRPPAVEYMLEFEDRKMADYVQVLPFRRLM
jgi:hypothetical protein